jgi:hypothetical protein
LSPSLLTVASLSYEIQSPMQHCGPTNKLYVYCEGSKHQLKYILELNQHQSSIKNNQIIFKLKSTNSHTSSNTRLMNLNESMSVRIISATGTPRCVRGSINHRKANASSSGVVVVRHRLALWNTFHKNMRPSSQDNQKLLLYSNHLHICSLVNNFSCYQLYD